MWKSGFPLEKLLAKERQEAKTRRGQKVGGTSMGWFAHSGALPLHCRSSLTKIFGRNPKKS